MYRHHSVSMFLRCVQRTDKCFLLLLVRPLVLAASVETYFADQTDVTYRPFQQRDLSIAAGDQFRM